MASGVPADAALDAGYDGAKRRKGSKVHIAVGTLGHLIALTVTRPTWAIAAMLKASGPTDAGGYGKHGRTRPRRPGLHRR